MIHYLENKVGVVDFANAQGLVKLLNFSDRKGTGSLTMNDTAPFPYYSRFLYFC